MSNIINMIAGILVGLLLPKIMGVTDYGYYKTFTLYAGYIGFFHFGMVDGILLIYGGKNYDELDKKSFSFYSKFLFVLELFLSIVIATAGLLFLPNELKIIFFLLAFNLVCTNMVSYFQCISQITNRFTELSFRTIIQASLTALSVILLWIINRVSGTLLSYLSFTIIFCLIRFFLFVWYVATYKDIVFGNSISFKEGKKDAFHFMRCGIFLLVANLVSTLILNIDRQFVSLLYDVDTYAVYAFAYNLLGLITTAISAVSVVLYPTLKRSNVEDLQKNYQSLIDAILVVVFLSLIIYFPLIPFIESFLPKYYGSLEIFRIILPGLALSAPITLIMHNYYKTIGKNQLFFVKGIIILAISVIANFIAYYIFGTTVSISIASVVIMVLWFAVSETTLANFTKSKNVSTYIYILLMIISFYMITVIPVWWISMAAYIVIFAFLTYLLKKNVVCQIFRR